MGTPIERKEHGQALVQVSVMMVVLLLAVALAVDVGHAYERRRQMQNAADAAALAGAHSICFGGSDRTAAEIEQDARDAAEEYAILNEVKDENWVDISFPEDWKIAVTAREDTPTFILGIIGMDTFDVGAVAEAACGTATYLCDIWPISFRLERWNDLPCYPQDDGVFYVWNDDTFEEANECYDTLVDPDTGEEVCYPICDVYDDEGGIEEEGACLCNMIPPDNDAWIIGPGHRGWLLLPEPEEPYEDLFGCKIQDCGVNQTKCWLQNGEYTGRVGIPFAEMDLCLPGDPGVSYGVHQEIQALADVDAMGNVLIWDRECDEEDPEPLGDCPGTPYHIVDAGCIQILDLLTVDLMRKEDFRPPDMCAPNVKVIKARKLCDCSSECGSTIGGPPQLGGVNAVSLIR